MFQVKAVLGIYILGSFGFLLTKVHIHKNKNTQHRNHLRMSPNPRISYVSLLPSCG